MAARTVHPIQERPELNQRLGMVILALLLAITGACARAQRPAAQAGNPVNHSATGMPADPPATDLYLPQIAVDAPLAGFRHVTWAPGSETQPALAPHGQWLVYVQESPDGAVDLFRAELAGGAPIPLTQSPEQREETPVVSPDGTTIAFAAISPQGWDVFLMDADGRHVRPVAAAAESDERQPAFAPDGLALLFASDHAQGNWDLYRVNLPPTSPADVTRWERLTADAAVQRFPVPGHGGLLLYRQEEAGNSDLFSLQLHDGRRRRLTAAPAFEGYPAATPAHAGVVFLVAGTPGTLWQMNDGGGQLNQLALGDGWAGDTPRLSHDGRQLAFAAADVRRTPGNFDIFVSAFADPLLEIGDAGAAHLGTDCGWEAGVLAYGWVRAWESTGDLTYWRWLKEWVDGCMARRATITHVNELPLAHAALVLYAREPDERYWALAVEAGDYVFNQAPRSADGALIHLAGMLWDDTLIVTLPYLLAMGEASGDGRYREEAVDQLLLHAASLQHANGLFHHAWDAAGQAISGPAFWARGNGWVLASTAELLRALPGDHPRRSAVLAIFQHHAAAVVATQDASGLWPTVLDEPTFYLESSGSALLAAGLLQGVQHGWLTAADTRVAAAWARQAVMAQVQSGGAVGRVSGPTGPMLDRQAYNGIPVGQLELYGQGSVLLMGAGSLP